MSIYICRFMYVDLCMSIYVCRFMYVDLCMSIYVCRYIYIWYVRASLSNRFVLRVECVTTIQCYLRANKMYTTQEHNTPITFYDFRDERVTIIQWYVRAICYVLCLTWSVLPDDTLIQWYVRAMSYVMRCLVQ